MKERFHKTMIPSEKNDGVPLLLQASGAAIVMLTAFAFFALANFHGSIVKKYAGSEYAAVVSAVLIDQTNDARQDKGLSQLEPNIALTASAQLKANDMAKESYFAHVSPSGLSPWHWFEQAGYKFSYAGENLAVNFRDSGSVSRAWMNSPTHRANIVNANFDEIGIATSSGRYKGKSTTYVAQHFGSPYQEFDFQSLEELLGRELSVTEKETAIDDAEMLLAAVGQVNFVEKLMIQPNKIYSTIFLVLLLIVLAIAVNSYVKADTRTKQKHVLLHAGMVAIVLIALGLASLELLDTEVIAGISTVAN